MQCQASGGNLKPKNEPRTMFSLKLFDGLLRRLVDLVVDLVVH